jgi:branched-chain amino acid transport system substrate-binding protein
MKRFSIVSSAVLVGALALGVAPATAADPGITAKEIKLGMSSPIQGDAGKVYGKLPGAMKAYFNYINDNGGVYGRKINLIHRDDKYSPTLAAKQTTQLVINDKVFAIVGALGTPTHKLAYTSAQLGVKKVPDLFVNTGYSEFADLVKYPTAFTVLPSYAMEAKVVATYIKSTESLKSLPSAFIAQDDEFGKDSTKGFANAGYKFSVPYANTFYPQGTMTLDRAKGALTTLNGLGIKLLVLNTTADVSAIILKAAESLKLEKNFP